MVNVLCINERNYFWVLVTRGWAGRKCFRPIEGSVRINYPCAVTDDFLTSGYDTTQPLR